MPGLVLSAFLSNKSFDKTNVCSIECTRLALLERQYCLTYLLVNVSLPEPGGGTGKCLQVKCFTGKVA